MKKILALILALILIAIPSYALAAVSYTHLSARYLNVIASIGSRYIAFILLLCIQDISPLFPEINIVPIPSSVSVSMRIA